MIPLNTDRRLIQKKACRSNIARVVGLAIFVTPGLVHLPASADELWLADPITGCQIWGGDDPAAANDVVSWSGDCRGGKARGRGVLSWFAEGALFGRYEGEMLGGRLDGEGRLFYKFDDGFALVGGEFENGLPNGGVAIRFANGDRFRGTVENGLDTGQGVYMMADGSKLKGAFRDGKFNGEVVSESPDGEVFKGTFKDNERHEGLVIYPNGGRYEGGFAEGEPHGAGTFTTAFGDVYRGMFLNGYPEGEVEVLYADGRSEKQTWRGGKRSDQ